MSLSPRLFQEHLARVIAVVCIVSLVFPLSSAVVKADEIPHENYDYVSSDLGVVFSLLNLSIAYFEASFVSLGEEDVAAGLENLSRVNVLLGPIESVLDDIADVAESHDDLSSLIPPFAALADEEAEFIEMEGLLIDAREILRSFSGRASLSDNETIAAMTALNEASYLIGEMNASIDSMMVAAAEITSISVDGDQPFSESNLLSLIENLRNQLYSIELELVDLVEGGDGGEGGPGIVISPFLSLWISDIDLYLGDSIAGGGYLYYDGSFSPGQQVEIVSDGSVLIIATTSALGAYEFRYPIPLASDWLGTHEMLAHASWSEGNLTSIPIVVTVSLIPTSLVVNVNSGLLSPLEMLNVSIFLRDVRGMSIPEAAVSLTIDGVSEQISLDMEGKCIVQYSAEEMGIGNHTLRAQFGGGLPFAPCVSQSVTITIDIPTYLELTLVSHNVYLGYYLVGEGLLDAEATESMEGMQISLFIDGAPVGSSTTGENGTFSFAISTESIAVGRHVLRAEFTNEDIMWRHSEDEAEFRIYTTQQTAKYPFWPIIPGWGDLGAPPEIASDLFFGEYAYFGWLLVIGVIAISVKTWRMRKESQARKGQFRLLVPVEGFEPPLTDGESLGESEGSDPFDLVDPPDAPNERIVWSYNHLLRFLVRSRKVQIAASMTHREIARLLEVFGYPGNTVIKVTNLFEMARYSGATMTESEMNSMGRMVDQLKSAALGGRRLAA